MYKIKLDPYHRFLSWQTMRLAYQKQIFDLDVIAEYADMLLEHCNDEENTKALNFILADGDQKINVLTNNAELCRDSDDVENLRILRYIVLDTLAPLQNKSDLLQELEKVYADFDYPKDMESFIAYMPCNDPEDDPTERTTEENEARLLWNFERFMAGEKDWIHTQFS